MTATQQPSPEPSGSSGGMRRLLIIVVGGFIVVTMLLFLLVLILAVTTDVEQTSSVVRLIRDLVIIFLALEGILIIASLAILIAQVAQLVDLLRSEIKPILDNTQDTVKTAQGTIHFVSDNLTEPVTRMSGFLAGTGFLVSQLFGIRRAVERVREQETDEVE